MRGAMVYKSRRPTRRVMGYSLEEIVRGAVFVVLLVATGYVFKRWGIIWGAVAMMVAVATIHRGD